MAKKQKSGLYRTKVKIGVNPDGSGMIKWISGRTKSELEAERRRVVEYFIEGKRTASDRQFGALAQQWFAALEKVVARNEKSDATLESYRTALNRDILPVFGDRNIRAIQARDLQDYVDKYAGKSQTKITYITATLNGVLKLACTERIIQRNPFEDVEKPAAKEAAEKRALTEEEREQVIRVSKEHPKGAYIACMYYLGARPGEIRGLQWGDFDWKRGLVHIQRDIDYKKKGENKVGALKNAKSNRWVPVPKDLKEILLPLKGEYDSFVFVGERNGNHLAKSTADRLWIELMKECGMVTALPTGANGYRESDIRSKYKAIITPHCMRHNYVTMCWEKGVDVYTASKLVGHKSIKTTMDIYTHLSEQQMEKAIKDVAAMFE